MRIAVQTAKTSIVLDEGTAVAANVNNGLCVSIGQDGMILMLTSVTRKMVQLEYSWESILAALVPPEYFE